MIQQLGLAVLTFILLSVPVTATTSCDSVARPELTKGISSAENYNRNDAAPHFALAYRLFRACGDERNAQFAKIGYIWGTLQQRNFADESHQLETLIRTSAVQRDAELLLWAYIVKGDVDQDLQYPSVAQKDWEAVARLAKETNHPKWIYRAKGELAIPAYYEGNIALSRSLVTQALTAASSAQDSASVVRLLTHIGTVYAMLGQYENALEHLNKALSIAQQHPEQAYPANVQIGRMMALEGQGHLQSAEALAKEVLSVLRSEKHRLNEAETHVILASIYRQEHNPTQAIQELQEAVRIAGSGSYQLPLGKAEFALADIYRSQGDLRTAEMYATRGLEATHDSGHVTELPVRMDVLALLKTKEGKFEEANSLYQRAANEIDAQLAFAPFSTRPLLLKSGSDIYTHQFELMAEHFPSVDKAYRMIEQVRARSIYSLLRTGSLSQSPQTEAAEQEISALRLQLAKAKTDAQVAVIRDHIFIASHQRWLSNEEVSTLRRSPDRFFPLLTVERQLRASEVLIEYIQTDSNLYAVVITNRQARLAKLAKTSDTQSAVASFVQAIAAKRDAINEGARLWPLLLNGISEVQTHSHLLIVPDAELYAVPFNAIVTPTGKRVLETYVTTRIPSASTYVLLRNRPPVELNGGLLAVGGVIYNRDMRQIAQTRGWNKDVLGNLPYSVDEVYDAERALNQAMPTTLLMGTKATETAFRNAQLADRKIIHLAVHGVASPNNSDRAALFFLDDAHEDGVLEIAEVARLQLRAELVSLSACQTAVGPSQGEDGVFGLSRAFLLAGARTVLATLWPIDDTFSERIISYFYQGLAQGLSPAEALAVSQRAVVQQFSDRAVPYYWAGFVVAGSADHPIVNNRVGAALLHSQGQYMP